MAAPSTPSFDPDVHTYLTTVPANATSLRLDWVQLGTVIVVVEVDGTNYTASSATAPLPPGDTVITVTVYTTPVSIYTIQVSMANHALATLEVVCALLSCRLAACYVMMHSPTCDSMPLQVQRLAAIAGEGAIVTLVLRGTLPSDTPSQNQLKADITRDLAVSEL